MPEYVRPHTGFTLPGHRPSVHQYVTSDAVQTQLVHCSGIQQSHGVLDTWPSSMSMDPQRDEQAGACAWSACIQKRQALKCDMLQTARTHEAEAHMALRHNLARISLQAAACMPVTMQILGTQA